MARSPQKPGELRDGLVLYPGGKVWYYLVRWKKGEKPRRGSTGCTSRTAAAEWLRREKERWANQEHEAPVVQAPTLLKIWEQWDELVGAVKSPTYRRYMNGVVHQHLHEWAERPATELTTTVLETLRARYMSSEGKGFRRGGGHTTRKHSEGGWNRVFGQIRTLLKWAVLKKLLATLPYDIPAKAIRLTSSAKTHGVLWPEEVPAFLDAVDVGKRSGQGGRGKKGPDPYRPTSIAIRLMVYLGLREGEALNMEWDRIDWRRKLCVVAECRTTGKRVKDRSAREVPMGPKLESYLRTWWEQEGRPDHGLVVPNATGWALGEGSTTKHVHRGAVALKKHLTPHGLRATFATGHWEIGTALTQIAQMMGDAAEVVTKHYIFQRPKDQAASQERLEAAMSGSTTVPPDPSMDTN